MDPKLKDDVVLRAGLAFVVLKITGKSEFTGAVELDFRGGRLRDSRPSFPSHEDRKEIGFLLKDLLPGKKFSGTVQLGLNLGVVNSVNILQ